MIYKDKNGNPLGNGDILYNEIHKYYGVFYEDEKETRIDFIYMPDTDIRGKSIFLPDSKAEGSCILDEEVLIVSLENKTFYINMRA